VVISSLITFIHELPTRRRKHRDNDNDKENGLRMRNEKEKLKEKRFSFFADPQKEERYPDTQLAHCLLPVTQANASQKSKSQFFPTLNPFINTESIHRLKIK